MDTINTLVLVGGIASESLNKKFYNSLLQLPLHRFAFKDFDLSKLPYFSQDLENNPPEIVVTWKEMIKNADAVLFITPEYNRSFPGVLKNAIDWGSRPYGQNLWDKKAAAILGASPGAIGTFGAQHHLRQVLAYLNMSVLGQPEIYFNATDAFENGQLKSQKSQDIFLKFFDAFEDWYRLTGEEEQLLSAPQNDQTSSWTH